jgi:four helix bundle protein
LAGQLSVGRAVVSWQDLQHPVAFGVLKNATLARAFGVKSPETGPKPRGSWFALLRGMKEITDKRKRTLALQQRAIRFSVAVNQCCPRGALDIPSTVVWGQLVRAADSTSNNLVEAEGASSDADFLNKMRIALREAKESRTCLSKIRQASLTNASAVVERDLEQEADELAAIFATIIMNMERRIASAAKSRRR